ncbi:hypothetical protein DFH11DRAFT_1564156 [Phellopilus nigrolimitatus]|nr:hypothetical protein DFH11DRAFT_1564156 [Phellopilus nigrolimitatus]
MERTNDHKLQLTYLKRKLEDLEEVHKEGKKTHALELEELKSELERSRKTNKEQAEHTARLKKHHELSESRVQELKKTVSSSQFEVRELRNKLRGAEQERDKLAGKQSDAAETRKALTAAEARKKSDLQEKEKRIGELQRSLEREKQRATIAEAKSEESKTALEKETREAQLKEHSSASTTDSLTAQVSQLQESLRLTVTEYGRLASSTISLTAYDSLKLESASLQLQIARLERKLANSDEQVHELAHLIRQMHTTNTLLSDQLHEAHAELLWFSAESKFTSNYTLPSLSEDNLYSEIETLLTEERTVRSEEEALLNDVLRVQIDVYRMNGSQLKQHLASAELALSKEQAEVSRLKETLAESDLAITKMSKEGEARKKELYAIENENAGRATEILGLQEKLEDAKKELVITASRAKAEVSKREDLLRKERELTGRLHSTIQKSKMAEDALRAEIEQLSAELAEEDAYREAYHSIADEMRGLVARNVLAEDEAQRLSKFNAEILGHSNPTQKILYVDRIRRELADTKQKLAVSTHENEAALSDLAQLSNELMMYKSIAVPFEGKPRTNMTRIRRVPLGTQTLNVQPPEGQPEGNYDDLAQYLPDTTNGNMTVEELS